MKLIIKYILLLFITTFNLNAQSSFKIIKTDSNIEDGVYILYNDKSCLPCSITLSDYILKIKERSNKKYYCIAYLDSSKNSISQFKQFYKYNLSFVDSTIYYWLNKPNNNFSILNQLINEPTPAILILKNENAIFFSYKDIFTKGMKISKKLKKQIKKDVDSI